ncbi:MAG: GGDEF domain-containing protein [Lachnospiraceae bacterium]|nr:GGDEF domain-containing protein [Lachnospiraceae bacterium]
MTLRIASAEIVSLCFLLIILFSLLRNADKSSISNRLFIALTVSSGAGLLADAFSYILDEYRINRTILTLSNILAFSAINVCITLFAFYLISFIRKKIDLSYKIVIPVIFISALDILLIILGTVNGKFFSVKNGRLVYGPWDDFLTIMPLFGVVVILIIMVCNLRYIGKRDTAVLSSFVVFPLISAVILIFLPDLEFGYLATALSCAVMFTFIRREEIAEAHNREQIIKELSTQDSLTGLLNRRGYYEVLEQESDHNSLGIVFCDLNALKYTNDNFGHMAGDAYIRKFAMMLQQIFGEFGHVCRIGGDEFVVLLHDIDEDGFKELKDKLNSAIRENEKMASAGYAYGDIGLAMDLIRHAEEEMYIDKNRYYQETGQDRRRQANS